MTGFSGLIQSVQNQTDLMININIGENMQSLFNRTAMSILMPSQKMEFPTIWKSVRRCLMEIMPSINFMKNSKIIDQDTTNDEEINCD